MRFPDVGLVIGTEEVSNEPHIALPRAAAGVSRRHCSLRREGERTVLIDHSRHGTWVNGARVRERAPVRPGDRVRVGTPGVEFTLISAAAFGARAVKKRRAFEVFTLSFLDCICCGFGAVVLFYTIVQAQSGVAGNAPHRRAHRRGEQARGGGAGRHAQSRAAAQHAREDRRGRRGRRGARAARRRRAQGAPRAVERIRRRHASRAASTSTS